MQGGGNDFMLINGIDYPTHIHPDKKLIQQWADRSAGIGFDQLLIVAAATVADADFDYRIFNADGREVAQCGNGARCVALYVTAKGLTNKKTMRLRSAARVMEITMQDDNTIAVDMGAAVFEPKHIPFVATDVTTSDDETEKKLYTVDLVGRKICFSVLSFGNPHAVIRVDDIKATAVAEIGAALQAHPCFPQSVNVSFVEVGNDILYARVYERGVGETQSCGSGACAIAVIARLHNWLPQAAHTIPVQLTGGILEIQFEQDQVKLVGPAELVYEDQIAV